MHEGAALKVVASEPSAGSSRPVTTTVESALSKWRHAFAALSAFDAETKADEEALSALIDEIDHLARSIMQTPVSGIQGVLAKVEVLECLLANQYEFGQFTDCRDVMMISTIKADLLSLRSRTDESSPV